MSPTDDAYERVTNPERYVVLGQVADDLVEALRSRPGVRSEAPVRDQRLDRVEVERAVRLSPGSTGAAIVVAWTLFPGVFVLAGDVGTFPFPRCGCDACDEDPTELVDDLRWHIETIVQGGYSESIEARGGHEGIRVRLEGVERASSSWARRAPSGGPRRDIQTTPWGPW